MAPVAWTSPHMLALSHPAGRRVAAIASRQHGVVARFQLLAAGIPCSTVSHWTAAGHLLRVHRGVYAVGHRSLTREARWMAAVLAAGRHAFLSHWTAAEAWGIVRPDPERPFHLSSSVRAGSGIGGLVVHRPRRLEQADLTRRRGIPATTATRALFDLATCTSRTVLRRAFERAEYMEHLDRRRLDGLCSETSGRRGLGMLRELLAIGPLPLERTRSGPERRFLEICRDFEIAIPAVNVPLLGFEVDFLWERERFVVEIDGGHHARPEQRDRDHARDAALGRAGYLVRRFRDQALRRAAPVAREVIQTLAERDPDRR